MAKLTDAPSERWTLADGTLSREAVADPKRRVSVEIGDAKQPQATYPQVKTLHWDNEANLSVRLADDDPEGGTVQVIDDKFEWSRAGRTARIYELPADGDQLEDGGIEFEVELAERPATDVLVFTIQTKGLAFLYQGALTEDEIAEGKFERPENVVGSYAVYHAARRGNYADRHYRAGKAFHIFRPHAVDALGAATWCDLDIDVEAGTLSVTVPGKFLDEATYPVVVDPTIGHTSVGATSISDSTAMWGTAFDVPADVGTVESFTYRTRQFGTTGFVGCLYEEDGADDPGALVGYTDQLTGFPANSENWYTATFPTPVDIAAYASGRLFLAVDFQASTDRMKYDAGTYSSFSNSASSPGYPTPRDPATASTTRDHLISMYVTYVEAAGGTTYEDAIALGLSAGVAGAAALTFGDGIGLGVGAGVSDASQAELVGAITVATEAGVSAAGSIVLQATVAWSQALAAAAQGTADMDAAAAIGAGLGVSIAGGLAFAEAIAAAFASGTATAVSLDLSGSVALGASAGAAADNQMVFAASAAIGLQVAAAAVANAIIQAGISLASVTSLTITAEAVVANIETPDGRTLSVSAGVRSLSIKGARGFTTRRRRNLSADN